MPHIMLDYSADMEERTDIAALCGLLASEEGGFISGQMIACNGATET